MKRFKKALAMVLTGALVMGCMLTGCGGSGSSSAAAGSQAAESTGGAAASGAALADGATASKGVLKVGMECAFPPYNWTQSDDSNGAVPISNASGSYTNGYDIKVAKKVCEALGLKLEVVKTEWTGLPPALSSGKIDAIIAGMSPTKERRETIDFTENYFVSEVYAMVLKDGKFKDAKTLQDLKGAVCTSQQNTFWYDDIIPQIPEGKKQNALADVPTMLSAMTSGKVEVLISDKPTAISAAKANDRIKAFTLATDPKLQVEKDKIDVCVGLKKGNKALADAVNGVLKDIPQDVRETLMNEAIDQQPAA